MERNSRKFVVLILLASFLLVSCANTYGPGPKATIGGLGGAAAGGLIAAGAGGNPAAIAAGSLLGLLVGGAIGDYMDAQDRRYAYESTHYALESLPSGQTAQWRNPDNGHYGTVTPNRTYTQYGNQYCREFTQTAVIDGRRERVHGTACREPDGSWRIN